MSLSKADEFCIKKYTSIAVLLHYQERSVEEKERGMGGSTKKRKKKKRVPCSVTRLILEKKKKM